MVFTSASVNTGFVLISSPRDSRCVCCVDKEISSIPATLPRKAPEHQVPSAIDHGESGDEPQHRSARRDKAPECIPADNAPREPRAPQIRDSEQAETYIG